MEFLFAIILYFEKLIHTFSDHYSCFTVAHHLKHFIFPGRMFLVTSTLLSAKLRSRSEPTLRFTISLGISAFDLKSLSLIRNSALIRPISPPNVWNCGWTSPPPPWQLRSKSCQCSLHVFSWRSQPRGRSHFCIWCDVPNCKRVKPGPF